MKGAMKRVTASACQESHRLDREGGIPTLYDIQCVEGRGRRSTPEGQGRFAPLAVAEQSEEGRYTHK